MSKRDKGDATNRLRRSGVADDAQRGRLNGYAKAIVIVGGHAPRRQRSASAAYEEADLPARLGVEPDAEPIVARRYLRKVQHHCGRRRVEWRRRYLQPSQRGC